MYFAGRGARLASFGDIKIAGGTESGCSIRSALIKGYHGTGQSSRVPGLQGSIHLLEDSTSPIEPTVADIWRGRSAARIVARAIEVRRERVGLPRARVVFDVGAGREVGQLRLQHVHRVGSHGSIRRADLQIDFAILEVVHGIDLVSTPRSHVISAAGDGRAVVVHALAVLYTREHRIDLPCLEKKA